LSWYLLAVLTTEEETTSTINVLETVRSDKLDDFNINIYNSTHLGIKSQKVTTLENSPVIQNYVELF
jgi:hypothetical protein